MCPRNGTSLEIEGEFPHDDATENRRTNNPTNPSVVELSVQGQGMEGSPRQGWFRCLNCSSHRFNGVKMSQGFAINNAARGVIVMSNIFLTASFLYLANQEAKCLDNDNDEIRENCDGKVRRFSRDWNPSTLIAYIPVISGILTASLMPLIGAIMDYSPHRWNVGVVTAVLLTLIQGVQIYTVDSTWFPMVILQAFAGFLYETEVLSTFAYLPDIARLVGESTMTNFQSTFTIVQFSAQSIFLIIVIAIAYVLRLDGDNVVTAQMSQGINTFWIIICFPLSWRLMPHVPPARELPAGRSIWTAGFAQVGRTAVRIHRDFSRSLQWFLLAVIFAEASVNAFTVVAVIYLGDHIGLDSQQIGIFFLTTLLASLPGSAFGAWVTSRIQPKNSYRLCLIVLAVVTIVGALFLEEGMTIPAFGWGVCVGASVGWYYPTENLFFSLCLPRGQDAEFAGFFVYCTQILVWLPPLVFAVLVEADVDQQYGVMSCTSFMVIAVVLLSFLPSWDEILQDALANDGNTSSPVEAAPSPTRDEGTAGTYSPIHAPVDVAARDVAYNGP